MQISKVRRFNRSWRVSAFISTGSDSDLGLNLRQRQREKYRFNVKPLKKCVLVSSIESYCSLWPKSLALPVLIDSLRSSYRSGASRALPICECCIY
jgi:hypothetical protein